MKIINSRLSYGPATFDTTPIAMVFTGNSFVTRDRRLVMGRGAAKEVRDMYPGLDAAFGTTTPHLGFYGLQSKPAGTCGLTFPMYVFQVKYNFADEAHLSLIQHSAAVLKTCIDNSPGWSFLMNFPGVGNGRLRYEDVLSVLEAADLSDQLLLYYENNSSR